MRKLYIKTYGCQMNAYDSERMAELLLPYGYESISESVGADLVILNTCHIREKAAEKLYSDLGRLLPVKERARSEGRLMLVGVGGCVGQAEGDEIMRRSRVVDFVFGPQTYHKLPRMVESALSAVGGRKSRMRLVDTEFTADEKFDSLGYERVSSAVSGFVTVQEGCDKFCTFCVVPYTRGAEYSRPAIDIINEVKALVVQGVREVTLLGQNVNAYHGDGVHGGTWSLAHLIDSLAEIADLHRIRYMTSHPRDMDDELIKAHGRIDKLMPYLHLPVQSGSDSILKAMNRGHTATQYLNIIDRLKSEREDIAITSDFIIGFPEETENDFIDTLKLVQKVDYAAAYSFKYSTRPGTPAANKTQIPENTKNERLQTLQQLLKAQQNAFNHKQKGNILPVLFEKLGKHPEQIVGRSPYLQPVHINASNPNSIIGKIIPCIITQVNAHSLFGEITNAKNNSNSTISTNTNPSPTPNPETNPSPTPNPETNTNSNSNKASA